jgi:hypothetical protein
MFRILPQLTMCTSQRRFARFRSALLAFSGGLAVCGIAAAQAPPPPACFQGAPVAGLPHPTVRRSYIEIVYDAFTRELWWVDRAGVAHGGHSVLILENSVFAPVTFVKDRIIVTICNAKFNTEPAISVATTVIPESAPDIRGLTAQSTATPLAAPSATALAAEAKQAAAPPTPKTAEDYAQMAASYHETFRRLMTELSAVRCAPFGSPAPLPPCALDTVWAIQRRATDLQTALLTPPPPSDQADFDSFSARTKSLVDSINGLASTLAAGDYLSRAVVAANAYAALKPATTPRPDVDLIVERAAADAKVVADAANQPGFPAELKNDAAAAAKGVIKAAGDLQADPTASDGNVSTARTAAQSAVAYLLHIQQLPNPEVLKPAAQALIVDAHELLTAAQPPKGVPSLDDINKALGKYLGNSPRFQDIVDQDVPELLFQQTDGLSQDVTNLHATASAIFDSMNTWRENSRVTLTGVAPPTSGNAVFTVHIILHEAYAPFAFGAAPKKDSTSDSAKSSSGTITAAAATAPAPEQHEVRRVLVEVHRRADANLVGAVIGSNLPDRTYGLQPGAPITATGATTPVVPYYPYTSQNEHLQMQAILGINWYPGGRDFYPGYLRGARRLVPGILFGTTVSSAGNFVAGLDFEPVNGIDFIIGGELGPVSRLASGVTLGANPSGAYFASGDTVPTQQRLGGGVAFGIGFDLSVFTAIFTGGGSAPSSGATSAPASPLP